VAATNHLSAASYDGAGNQLTWGGYSYAWDPFQMGKTYQGGGNDWAFVTTPEGERILSYDATTGTSTFRLRDLDGKVVREIGYGVSASADPGGGLEPGGPPRPLGERPEGDALGATYVWSWQRDWIHREGQPLASVSPTEGVRYLHPDHLGTPRVITTSTGAVAVTNHYYPFGEHAGGTGSSLEPLRFTGHERDPGMSAGAADDLDFMHARYYHPQLGRFLAVDPAGGKERVPQSWNRYSYVLSTPTVLVDPDGAQPKNPNKPIDIAYKAYRIVRYPQDVYHGGPHYDILRRKGGAKIARVSFKGKIITGKVSKRLLKFMRGAGLIGSIASVIFVDQVNADEFSESEMAWLASLEANYLDGISGGDILDPDVLDEIMPPEEDEGSYRTSRYEARQYGALLPDYVPVRDELRLTRVP
jgi:RHS repeat-associated protein